MDITYYINLPKEKEVLERKTRKTAKIVLGEAEIEINEDSGTKAGYKVVYSDGYKLVVNHYFANGKYDSLILLHPNNIIQTKSGAAMPVDNKSLASFFRSYDGTNIVLNSDFIHSISKYNFSNLLKMLTSPSIMELCKKNLLNYNMYELLLSTSTFSIHVDTFLNPDFLECLVLNSPIYKTTSYKYGNYFVYFSYAIFKKFGKEKCAKFVDMYSKSTMTGINGGYRAYDGIERFLSNFKAKDLDRLYTYMLYDFYRQGITSLNLDLYNDYIKNAKFVYGEEYYNKFPNDIYLEHRICSSVVSHERLPAFFKHSRNSEFEYNSSLKFYNPENYHEVLRQFINLGMAIEYKSLVKKFPDCEKNPLSFIFMKDAAHTMVDRIIIIQDDEIKSVIGLYGNKTLKDKEKMAILQYSMEQDLLIADSIM